MSGRLLCFSGYSSQCGERIIFPIFCVGNACPLRATYFRQDLPHVAGSPNLRVLWLIRLPFNHRLLSQLRVSQLSSRVLIILRYQRRTVSTSLRVSSISVSENNVIRGINGSLKFSNASLCTCHNLLTPEVLHILTNTNASVLVSVGVKPLTDLNFYFEAVCYASSQGLRDPYGLYISLCTLHLFCSGIRGNNISFLAFRHRRNTRYGWLVKPYPTRTYTLQDASRLNLTLIVVERPITGPTPHRSGRAELPHPAPQLYIHSCKTRPLVPVDQHISFADAWSLNFKIL